MSRGVERMVTRTRIARWCTIVLLLTVGTIAGCSKHLEGIVQDAAGNPVAGATVQIEGTDYWATTKKNGEYRLAFDPGALVIVVSKDGYQPIRLPVTASEASDYQLKPIVLVQGATFSADTTRTLVLLAVGLIVFLSLLAYAQAVNTKSDAAHETAPTVTASSSRSGTFDWETYYRERGDVDFAAQIAARRSVTACRQPAEAQTEYVAGATRGRVDVGDFSSGEYVTSDAEEYRGCSRCGTDDPERCEKGHCMVCVAADTYGDGKCYNGHCLECYGWAGGNECNTCSSDDCQVIHMYFARITSYPTILSTHYSHRAQCILRPQ